MTKPTAKMNKTIKCSAVAFWIKGDITRYADIITINIGIANGVTKILLASFFVYLITIKALQLRP